MPGKKALLISVGTGTREGAHFGLAGALAYSVKHHNPDKVFFVATKESAEKTLPHVIQGLSYAHETILVSDEDDIQQVYEDLEARVESLRAQYDTLVVDFTSGTKAMSGALSIIATVESADELSYITGKREHGTTISGTERIVSIRPYFATSRQVIRTAAHFFNRCNYDAASSMLEGLLQTRDPEIERRAKPLHGLAVAYSLWDKFCHERAFQALKEVRVEEATRNKRFLNRLVSEMGSAAAQAGTSPDEGGQKPDSAQAGFPEPYLIADLINNAERRAVEENKCDDAVARLYRAAELIAQYRLRKNYGINTSDADPEKIPEALLVEWGCAGKAKIKLDLSKDYRLLSELGDPLGEAYDEDFRKLLQSRNMSILAHGLIPVSRKTYDKLAQKVRALAAMAVENLEDMLNDSKFLKWPTA